MFIIKSLSIKLFYSFTKTYIIMRRYTIIGSLILALMLISALAIGQSMQNDDSRKLQLMQEQLTQDIQPGVVPVTVVQSDFDYTKIVTSDRTKDILWDNGHLVTQAGVGSGGSDYSDLQNISLGMGNYGFQCQIPDGYSLADDFDVVGSWTVSTFTFFAYQTNFGPPSSLNDVRFQVYAGDPSAGYSVIYGDLTTNKIVSTTWTNIWRTAESVQAENQPIMEIVADATGLELPPGTYWVEWQVGGYGTLGPIAPPVTIVGETTTGNALQNKEYWASVTDVGPQGFPFIIEGTTTAQPADDIGVSQIVSPSCCGMMFGDETVTIKINNYGTNSQSGFDVSYSVDGGTLITETVSATIASNDFYEHTFTATVNLSSFGTYVFEACSYLAGDESPANDCITKTVVSSDGDYCDALTEFQTEYIAHVLCGDIDNSSDWQYNVADYTHFSTDIESGMLENITVSVGDWWGLDIVYAWVDWNLNCTFEHGGNEEFILAKTSKSDEVYEGVIIVPPGTLEGTYRMRIRLTDGADMTPPEPCGVAGWGEVEDYSIVVLDGPIGITMGGLLSQSILIYPNPASDVVNIKSDFNITSIRLCNSEGQILVNEGVNSKMYQVNTSQCTPGLYFFQIETSEGILSKRIIVR
jgi:hypothetical protein